LKMIMNKKLLPAIAVFLAITACSLISPDAHSVLQSAQKAMGSVKSIQYSGAGMNGFFGQALTAGKTWPQRPLTSYTRTINYDQKSASEDMMFAQPVFGGQHQNTQVSGDKAWTMGPNGPAPQIAQAEARQLQIWLTPHGFVKGALDSGNATLKTDGGQNQVSFKALGKYTVTGTIDNQDMVTKVETTVADPVLGDLPIVATYSEYKDYNGVKFPTKILQTQGGFSVWDLTVSSVQPNAPADLPVPDAVKSASIPPVKVESTKLANGVWFLGGGSHHSLVVEFKDYIAIVEGPLNEARSLAVIEEAKKLVPNKPIKNVLSTHHHFDHAGGLRTYVAEGATIVTHQSNVSYFEKTFQAPATISPDAQSKNPKPATFQGVTDKYVLTDGKQTIEAYATQGDTHTDELLVFYLPASRILVEADSYSPGPPNAPPPSPAPPNAVTLYKNIQRLKLNVATIAPIHGRGAVSMTEFMKFIAKRS
jgi:glyoxylase-like metal-dependent hydrolase (beta-lactamase superfamily II)